MATTGVSGMIVFICFVSVRCCAGLVSGMTTMSTVSGMAAVHEEMASKHQRNEAIVHDRVEGYIENEDRYQRGNQACPQKPNNRWDAHGAIRYRGMRFHYYSFESNVLSRMSLKDLQVKSERRLAYFVMRRFADGLIRLV